MNATLKDDQAGYAGLYWLSDSITLNPGATYRVVLIHRAGETALSGTIYAERTDPARRCPCVNDYGPA